jgi:4-alpha-glucanotransferase
MKAFVSAQGWWVDDHALFHAIRARQQNRPWMEWPEPLQRRDPAAMDRAHREHERDVLFHQYVQWIADSQWQDARQAAHAHDVQLFGDLPFMVDADSADVWAHRHCFRLDVSVGAPPDAFSETGQDWGMPLYNWDVLARDDFRWLRARARRNADLYDGYRVDHLVGFYRTYGRPRDGAKPFFSPAKEPEQITLGERMLQLFKAPGADIIAEDLGSVPDYVRMSMSTLGVPGFCVLRWEREWHVEGQPFRDPTAYPPNSVAASGTHDTEPLATWWASAPEADQQQVSALETMQRVTQGESLLGKPYDPFVRDTLLEALYASGSNVLLLPVQDVFGWRGRINEPSTVNDTNWTFRLPWPCDRMDEVPEACERREQLRVWARRHLR